MDNNQTNDFKAFKASIARIYHGDGSVIGSGFLVSGEYVLTCAHVITETLNLPENTKEMPSSWIDLDFPLIDPGNKLQAQVSFWRPVSSTELVEDIAGLKLNSKLPNTTQPVRLVEAEDLWEHPIRVFGFPKGHNDGIWASGVLRDTTGKNWLQIEDTKVSGYQVERGFSGAPVWDEQLAGVVGMAVAAEKRRENAKAAFLISTKVLRQTLTELDQWSRMANTSKAPLTSLTPSQRRRLKRELSELQEHDNFLIKKLSMLRNSRIREVDPIVQLKRDVDIEETKRELNEIESKIDEIEQQLG
ncbi:trypsin-like peptidase domain-containing protein [Moorena sp. SIO3H5]|uniref:S1 family peptidase n=1 Tax=Moorena sp. SIO3H5 TaxID=2607834 RepID=UPI0025F01EEA|nr:trypsin-like peptidase domain-containing protein [Moorena sp. SIO3H5]